MQFTAILLAALSVAMVSAKGCPNHNVRQCTPRTSRLACNCISNIGGIKGVGTCTQLLAGTVTCSPLNVGGGGLHTRDFGVEDFEDEVEEEFEA